MQKTWVIILKGLKRKGHPFLHLDDQGIHFYKGRQKVYQKASPVLILFLCLLKYQKKKKTVACNKTDITLVVYGTCWCLYFHWCLFSSRTRKWHGQFLTGLLSFLGFQDKYPWLFLVWHWRLKPEWSYRFSLWQASELTASLLNSPESTPVPNAGKNTTCWTDYAASDCQWTRPHQGVLTIPWWSFTVSRRRLKIYCLRTSEESINEPSFYMSGRLSGQCASPKPSARTMRTKQKRRPIETENTTFNPGKKPLLYHF